MSTVKIFFSRLRPDAILPSKRSEDAGYDVYACFDGDYMKAEPHQTIIVPTGIASACGADYFFRIAERGSTGTKGIGQRCGVIDSGYRGEWFIAMTNLNSVPLYFIKPERLEALKESLEPNAIFYPTGKAICQALVLPVPRTEAEELSYDELCKMESARSAGKLGSSGK